MNITIVMIIIAIVLAFLAAVFASLWVYSDAKSRGLQAGMWVLLVLLSGNFIGLILYLLIGKKQERTICNKCGDATDIHGTFCSLCGEKIDMQNHVVKTNKGFLFACVTCIVLVFVSIGVLGYSHVTADGFAFERQYGLYRIGPNGSSKNVSQSSSGDTWELSFDKASGGSVFKKNYNATSQLLSLSVDIRGQGSVQLLVVQNGAIINETIQEGHLTYDMTAFGTGKISVQIVNIDASDFSGTLKMEDLK